MYLVGCVRVRLAKTRYKRIASRTRALSEHAYPLEAMLCLDDLKFRIAKAIRYAVLKKELRKANAIENSMFRKSTTNVGARCNHRGGWAIERGERGVGPDEAGRVAA